MKKNKGNRLARFFKLLYIKLVRINDTPQRIALGLGMGVFLGIIPGTGPIAALFLAWLFKINRAASLLGSLLTNTWINFVTVFPAIKIGAKIMKLDWQEVYNAWLVFLKDFHWANLYKSAVLKMILPVVLGYFVVAFCLGVVVYLITLAVLKRIRHKSKGNWRK